jgi:hypothetical protein
MESIMDQEAFVAMQQQEERLESALERMEAGDFLSDDDVLIIRWACGKPSKPKSKLAPVFEDWATIFRKQGVI